MMFEKQRSGIDKLKASSSTPENPSTLSSDTAQDTAAKSEQEGTKVNLGQDRTDPVDANPVVEGSSQELDKASDSCEPNVGEPNVQPTKRSRTE